MISMYGGGSNLPLLWYYFFTYWGYSCPLLILLLLLLLLLLRHSLCISRLLPRFRNLQGKWRGESTEDPRATTGGRGGFNPPTPTAVISLVHIITARILLLTLVTTPGVRAAVGTRIIIIPSSSKKIDKNTGSAFKISPYTSFMSYLTFYGIVMTRCRRKRSEKALAMKIHHLSYLVLDQYDRMWSQCTKHV